MITSRDGFMEACFVGSISYTYAQLTNKSDTYCNAVKRNVLDLNPASEKFTKTIISASCHLPMPLVRMRLVVVRLPAIIAGHIVKRVQHTAN